MRRERENQKGIPLALERECPRAHSDPLLEELSKALKHKELKGKSQNHKQTERKKQTKQRKQTNRHVTHTLTRDTHTHTHKYKK
jgi:hypothetical protein